MFKVINYPYGEFANPAQLPTEFILTEHANGFGPNGENSLYRALDLHAQATNQRYTVYVDQLYSDAVKEAYQNIEFVFSADAFKQHSQWSAFKEYDVHPDINHKNFVCSFNGSGQAGRLLFTAALDRFGYFNPKYSTKNFAYTAIDIDNLVAEYTGPQANFYRKFFITPTADDLGQTVISHRYQPFEHAENIFNLEYKLAESFVHVIGESQAVTACPIVTEKFLYSVVTRGLFVAYAQPGWHAHLEKHYGFKKYTKIFDYRFDTMENPVERLVELLTMLGKFKNLTTADWYDLYQMEQDTIEFNYRHYHSQQYLNYVAHIEYSQKRK